MDIEVSVESVCDYAAQHGFSTSTLELILRILLTPKTFDQNTANRLFRILYPIGEIPDRLLFFIIERLGTGKRKALYANQQAAIKWLTLVFDLVNFSSLSRCYAVLFNLLGVFPLRAHLCHLLAKLTRRKNVQASRVQYLRHLEEGITSDAVTSKLVDTFAMFAPGDFRKRKIKTSVVFSHPDRQWAESLNGIRSRWPGSSGLSSVGIEDFRLYSPSEATPMVTSDSLSTIKARDVESLGNLTETIEKLDLPTNADLNLTNRLSRCFIALEPQIVANDRIESIFEQFSEEQMALSEHEDRISDRFLHDVFDYSRLSKVQTTRMTSEGFL